ncbi:MAG: phage integrase SAM-like domain-containing protein, partial [Actinomycetota bacterium]|nr:phage integrase SAM-like domain-containing protein [Actinomycetota bacterium]
MHSILIGGSQHGQQCANAIGGLRRTLRSREVVNVANLKSVDGILKVGPQHYRVFIELPPKSNGKRRRESRTVRGSLQEAKDLRAQMLADKARGEYVGKSEQRLADYLESWLAWKESRVSGRTWNRYASLLRSSIIPALGHLRLQELTPQHLDEFYASSLKMESGQRKGSRLSPTTVHHRHVALKMALKRAVELGILVRNPADFTQPPRVNRPQMRVLDEAETAKLIGALEGTPAELVGYLALMTGARLGELLALRWCDLDLTGQVMYVRQSLVENVDGRGATTWYCFKEPKSGKGRNVDLDAGTVARLRAHRKAQSEEKLRLGIAWTDLDLV